MIDFFHKGASMTKKITGVAKIKGAPDIETHPKSRVTRIGTFFDEEDAVASILLEVADTPELRKVGLMWRSSLPDICGMLFDGLSGGGYFWMRNCLIPIDVAFLSGDGTITKIYSMPIDKEGKNRYNYGEDDKSAIEVNMGFLKKNGIKPGFRFESRALAGKEGLNGKD